MPDRAQLLLLAEAYGQKQARMTLLGPRRADRRSMGTMHSKTARPFLQPYTGSRCQNPADTGEWHLGHKCPRRGIDQTQQYGEDADENIIHG